MRKYNFYFILCTDRGTSQELKSTYAQSRAYEIK